jgi:hypothetical protein
MAEDGDGGRKRKTGTLELNILLHIFWFWKVCTWKALGFSLQCGEGRSQAENVR